MMADRDPEQAAGLLDAVDKRPLSVFRAQPLGVAQRHRGARGQLGAATAAGGRRPPGKGLSPRRGRLDQYAAASSGV